MKAYKGFDKNMKCRGFQFEAGKDYEEVLRKREATVQKLENMGHTVVDTILTTTPPADGNVALFYLSCDLNWMSQCDGVLFLHGWEYARGCRIEHAAAVAYGLKVFYSVPDVALWG